MIPRVTAFRLLQYIRSEKSKAPVLILVARDIEGNQVKNLHLGQNDYLIKTFDFDEINEQIQAINLKGKGNLINVFEIADLSVDITERRVYRANNEIILSDIEFDILECLIKNKGVVLSPEKIERNIQKFNCYGDFYMIGIYIRHLKKKIDILCEKELIHTVKDGYLLKEGLI